MMSKSEHTKKFILDSVSPIFNKKGYAATSLSDLTNATKLTKGAIYGNFENKEDLAIKAFRHNVKRVLQPLTEKLNTHIGAINKLFALTNYYREYYDFVNDYGGCPILNIASDTNNLNDKLFEAVKEVAKKLEESLEELIQVGISENEIKKGVNAKMISKNIYSMIEGSVFMAFMHKDKVYILEMMNHIDEVIKKELLK
ncbi:MAG: TetR family transcriptional regulator [Bacteroidetes bacterium MedPE-SWsnd-G1]|nr:MAG: TetR family transcriptional regulator [Bacteroidetes bacterium MedPE-SWsnd-G1]